MRLRSLTLALVVMLAGCTVPFDGATSPPQSGWSGDPDNPWRERTLTVAVDNSANASRDYTPMVREALAYWSRNAERYAGYPVDYRLRPDAENPDLRIRIVENIDECGTEGRTAGCAPIVTNASVVNRPAVVEVQGNFTADSTVHVLKHELGHTLGLRHDDRPQSVMQHRSKLAVLPKPDATERAMPWSDPELSVYVDYGNVSLTKREETRRQVNAALGYFAAGADGTVPGNVSFVRVDDRQAADVVIAFAGTAPCTEGAGSCGSLAGQDPDRDGALETYTHLRITLAGIDTRARGWHVGYWLGRGFGLRGEELPAPLRSDDPEVRRSEWWR